MLIQIKKQNIWSYLVVSFLYRTRSVSRTTEHDIMTTENLHSSVGNGYIVVRGQINRHGAGT